MLNNANTELPQPPSDHRMPFSLALLQGLEIFHLPLLLFTIIHSFDRIFYRWPSTPSVVMAVITAFFADLTIVIFLVVLQTVDRPIQDIVSIFILIYGILLLFTLMPLFRLGVILLHFEYLSYEHEIRFNVSFIEGQIYKRMKCVLMYLFLGHTGKNLLEFLNTSVCLFFLESPKG